VGMFSPRDEAEDERLMPTLTHCVGKYRSRPHAGPWLASAFPSVGAGAEGCSLGVKNALPCKPSRVLL
jgi:hypothetical protein